jgi:hypothetical protein
VLRHRRHGRYELSPGGPIQPSVGIWNLRELIRRTAVMDQEIGKHAMNMSHITNTAIAPVISFAQSHITWEDRMGDSDFQDRFSREYIRAESTGRQHGNVPFVLMLVQSTDPKKAAWANRTGAGVILTHELRALNEENFVAGYKRLLAFGYGKPESRVFNYWQADNPVRIEGTDATTLAVTKPGGGRAMIVVCDYGNGGEVSVGVDAAALSLKPTFAARDAESGQALTVVDGKVRFPIKKHDFRMIVLE